jgi:hypothetical protein
MVMSVGSDSLMKIIFLFQLIIKFIRKTDLDALWELAINHYDDFNFEYRVSQQVKFAVLLKVEIPVSQSPLHSRKSRLDVLSHRSTSSSAFAIICILLQFLFRAI